MKPILYVGTLLLAFLAACPKSMPRAPESMPHTSDAKPICDGSATMRLGFTSGGGFVASTYSFTNPYGHMYLFVDGRCRYFASVDFMQGLATGTLTDAEAEQLAHDIGWSQVEAWSSYQDGVCPDAGSSTITRAGFSATCICRCQDMGPPGLATAMQGAVTWTRKLSAAGAPSTGAMSAAALAQGPPTGQEFAWPLDRPLASIAALVQETEGVTKPARFDDSGDVAALRMLRRGAVTAMPGAQSIPVHDDGVGYVLLALDELPDDATQAIDVLVKSVRAPDRRQ